MSSSGDAACGLCSSPEVFSQFHLIDSVDYTPYEVCRCRSCGYAFNRSLADGDISHERLFGEHFYRGVYAGCFKTDRSPELYRTDEKFRWFKETLDRFESLGVEGSLLDVGCATGTFLDYARSRRWEVTGVEVSEYAAAEARKRFSLPVFCGPLHAADYPDARFDAVTLFDVIEHVLNPCQVIQEVHRILKPGGLVALITDNEASLIARLAGGLYRLSRGRIRYPSARAYPIFNVSYFNAGLLERLLKRAGFQMLVARKMDQAVARTWVSGKAERTALRLLYLMGRVTCLEYQVFMIFQKAERSKS